MTRGGHVYIMANFTNSVIYIGVTSSLYYRVLEHKEKKYPNSFTAKYNCFKLVYFEFFTHIEEAIFREKRLKKWNREWKINFIEKQNPLWIDLIDKVIDL
jgi:putative endonuclease